MKFGSLELNLDQSWLDDDVHDEDTLYKMKKICISRSMLFIILVFTG
jgi:hypothetical protein